jgi:hypothetical protein
MKSGVFMLRLRGHDVRSEEDEEYVVPYSLSNAIVFPERDPVASQSDIAEMRN